MKTPTSGGDGSGSDPASGARGPLTREELDLLLARVLQLAANEAAKSLDADSAKDVGQMVAVAVWQRWFNDRDGYRPPHSLEAWVACAARRAAAKRIRKRMRERIPFEGYEALREARTQGGQRPDADLDAHIVEARVAELLGAMPERLRTTLLQIRDEGLSYEAVAASGKMSVEMVHHYVRRGMKALREGLAGYADPEWLKARRGRPSGERTHD